MDNALLVGVQRKQNRADYRLLSMFSDVVVCHQFSRAQT